MPQNKEMFASNAERRQFEHEAYKRNLRYAIANGGLSVSEIADMYCCTPQAISGTLTRAINKIKKEMSQ